MDENAPECQWAATVMFCAGLASTAWSSHFIHNTKATLPSLLFYIFYVAACWMLGKAIDKLFTSPLGWGRYSIFSGRSISSALVSLFVGMAIAFFLTDPIAAVYNFLF